MRRRVLESSYVVCVKNAGYRSSLILRRIYRVVPDTDASDRGLLRIIDESGEDYLYPAKFFISIDLPKAFGRLFSAAT